MPIREKTLRVYPNPWSYIDHEGRPAGVVPFDFYEHSPNRGWVGAQLDQVVKVRSATEEIINGKSFKSGTDDHDRTWSYSTEPVEIPNTAYYRQAVSNGELVAANKATALACGIRGTEFEEPLKHLEKLKALAIEHFDAHNGEDAFAILGSRREQAAAAAAEAAKAATDAEKPAEVKASKRTAPSAPTEQPKGDI